MIKQFALELSNSSHDKSDAKDQTFILGASEDDPSVAEGQPIDNLVGRLVTRAEARRRIANK